MTSLRLFARTALLAAALAVPAATMLPGAAVAADSQGRFAPKGFGLDKCKDLSEAAKKGNDSLIPIATWLNGYVTAFNTFNQNVYDIAPWQSEGVMLTMIAGHCDTHPEDPLAIVAQKLVAYLMPMRMTSLGQPTEVKNGEQTIRIYPEVLKQAQQALIKVGSLSGDADGSFGPKTKTAFESYQAKIGIKKTGLPDQETLFRLFAQANGQG